MSRGLCVLTWLGVLVVLVAASVLLGAQPLAPREVWQGLRTGGETGDIVRELRVPRTVVGVLVGAALGASGAVIQAFTRNPLADPGVLGLNAGATLAVTLAVAVGGVTSAAGYVWFAVAGALVVAVVVNAVGSAGRGAATPLQLTLAGVAIGAVLTGLSSSLILQRELTFVSLRSWSVGSLVGRSEDVYGPVLPVLAAGAVLTALAARHLNALALGDDVAASLGVRVVPARAVVMASVTLLVGGAVAVAGPIGFIGLMVPHLARRQVGTDQRWAVPTSAVLGACLLLASDIVGRRVVAPGEVPAGIVTAFIGAPVLVVLARGARGSLR